MCFPTIFLGDENLKSYDMLSWPVYDEIVLLLGEMIQWHSITSGYCLCNNGHGWDVDDIWYPDKRSDCILQFSKTITLTMYD